jgi:two-component system, OmpR family, KDP operon response regulator KdpE
MSTTGSLPTSSARSVILVVEDEPRLVRLLRAILESTGHTVVVANTGERAIELAALETPRLVILDLLLPGPLDGYHVCQRIREFSMAPIIMLTARTMESDKLRGFAAGADDYVTKPFSAKELLARIQALLRRTEVPATSPGRIEAGEVVIDLSTYEVTVSGSQVELTPTEYRLLLTLARNPNRVIPHPTLLTEVWGIEYEDEIEYLRTYIRYLRKKIEPDPANPRYLRTRQGIGYYLATSDP